MNFVSLILTSIFHTSHTYLPVLPPSMFIEKNRLFLSRRRIHQTRSCRLSEEEGQPQRQSYYETITLKPRQIIRTSVHRQSSECKWIGEEETRRRRRGTYIGRSGLCDVDDGESEEGEGGGEEVA